jgi:hypothetical protein
MLRPTLTPRSSTVTKLQKPNLYVNGANYLPIQSHSNPPAPASPGFPLPTPSVFNLRFS